MKKFVSVILLFCLLFVSTFAKGTELKFKEHWAYSDIEELYNKKLIDNMDSSFIPDDKITRSRFINLLLSVVVSPEAVKIKDGLFVSDKQITRSEGVNIIADTLKLSEKKSGEFKFTDEQFIYNKASVYSVYQAGLILGYPNKSFKPDDTLTNAETAVIMNRIINKFKDENSIKLEIEKKFLIDINTIPINLEKADKYEIIQTYINFSPEVRIRKINEYYYSFALKLPKDTIGLARQEVEFNINYDEYQALFKKKEANSISKTRYQFEQNNRMVAVDIYNEELNGLAVAELEFDSKEDAEAFVPYDWFVKDVTSDKRYKNANLAQDGIPKN
jgi:CYTH domain-containing protein